MVWLVETAIYTGQGTWYDCNPLEFESEREATDFEILVNANLQAGGTIKVRRVIWKEGSC